MSLQIMRCGLGPIATVATEERTGSTESLSWGRPALLWIGLLFSVLQGILFSAPAHAASIATACDAGDGWYMVGIRARIGAWFDKIGPVCAQLIDPKIFSGHQLGTMYGGNGGAEPRELVCAPTEAITKLDTYLADGGKEVWTVTLYCTDLRTGNIRTISAKGSLSGAETTEFTECPFNQVAFGLQLEYGAFVNRAKIICAEYRSVPAPPPPAGGGNEPPPAPRFAIATTDTDMYATTAGGNAICTMHTGDNAYYRGVDESEPRWAHLFGHTGDCKGTVGWVWHDPIRQPSLKIEIGVPPP